MDLYDFYIFFMRCSYFSDNTQGKTRRLMIIITVFVSVFGILRCCGGYQADVWNYYVNQGVVTGGAYGSKQVGQFSIYEDRRKKENPLLLDCLLSLY